MVFSAGGGQNLNLGHCLETVQDCYVVVVVVVDDDDDDDDGAWWLGGR